jgi:hypothetical protein
MKAKLYEFECRLEQQIYDFRIIIKGYCILLKLNMMLSTTNCTETLDSLEVY